MLIFARETNVQLNKYFFADVLESWLVPQKLFD